MTQTIPLPKLALLAANLIPVLGILNSEWSIGTIMIGYWLENVVIGVFNALKLIAIPTSNYPGKIKKIAMTAFFTIHYGLFSLVHGVFVFVLFSRFSVDYWAVLLFVLGLVLSHGVSYWFHFIVGQEKKSRTAQELFTAPYRRVMVLHLTILLGGGLAAVLGQPVWALLLMTSLKIGIDLLTHSLEHHRSYGKTT